MAREAAKHIPYGGAIVNTGSVTGIEGSKALLDYSMTKGGIHAFTRSLAGSLMDIRRCRCPLLPYRGHMQADNGFAAPLSYRAPDNSTRDIRLLFSFTSA